MLQQPMTAERNKVECRGLGGMMIKYAFHITLQFLGSLDSQIHHRPTGAVRWWRSVALRKGRETSRVSYVTSLFIIHYYHHYMIETIIIHFPESNKRFTVTALCCMSHRYACMSDDSCRPVVDSCKARGGTVSGYIIQIGREFHDIGQM